VRTDAAGWTRRGLARAAVVAGVALGVGAGLGYLVAHEPAPRDAEVMPEPPRLAGAAELAVLAPLRPGAALADFEVVEIRAVGADGALRVVCARGEVVVALDVALAAAGGPPPPARAGRYAIFYALRAATPAEGERLATALAAVLAANASVAAPPGMTAYAGT